jgi:hypothetical protein
MLNTTQTNDVLGVAIFETVALNKALARAQLVEMSRRGRDWGRGYGKRKEG